MGSIAYSCPEPGFAETYGSGPQHKHAPACQLRPDPFFEKVMTPRRLNLGDQLEEQELGNVAYQAGAGEQRDAQQLHFRRDAVSIPTAHLKCPFGQLLYPCSPHGRQSKYSAVSTTRPFSRSGPKPKAGTVLQNTAVTGAFIAEAMCKGALSFT